YRSSGAGWVGSAAARHAQTPIVGMASSADGRGYWMVSSSGRVYAFGDASKVRGTPPRRSVAGIVASPRNGYWLFSTSGNVFRGVGAGWFGSVAAHRIRKRPMGARGPRGGGGGCGRGSGAAGGGPSGDARRWAVPGSAAGG